MNKRSALFDNIKAVMLILVAIGHTINAYKADYGDICRIIMQYVYVIHMPAFSFVTGYFSKDPEKGAHKAVKSVLIPFIIFNLAYSFLSVFLTYQASGKWDFSIYRSCILLPSSAFYYLVCVFFWKYFQRDLMKLRYPVATAIVMSLLVSLIDDNRYHIAYGSVFTLMPFFLLGVYCTGEHVKKIRSIPRIFGAVMLVLAVIPAVFLPYHYRNTRYTYEFSEIAPVPGMLYRLLYYLIASCMIAVVINLMTEKRCILSRIGENSIFVYAGLTFTAPHLYVAIVRHLPVRQNMPLNILLIIIFCTIAALLFSFSWERKAFSRLTDGIYGIFFKEE
jgi:fucose 4-O-acetylase-like acetyltransferase